MCQAPHETLSRPSVIESSTTERVVSDPWEARDHGWVTPGSESRTGCSGVILQALRVIQRRGRHLSKSPGHTPRRSHAAISGWRSASSSFIVSCFSNFGKSSAVNSY